MTTPRAMQRGPLTCGSARRSLASPTLHPGNTHFLGECLSAVGAQEVVALISKIFGAATINNVSSIEWELQFAQRQFQVA
jgi:hypothetical protein